MAQDAAKAAAKELDRVTALLCAVVKKVGVVDVTGLAEWAVEHEAKDKARQDKERKDLEARQAAQTAQARREAEKAAALAKLTAEERAALGVR